MQEFLRFQITTNNVSTVSPESLNPAQFAQAPATISNASSVTVGLLSSLLALLLKLLDLIEDTQ